MIDGLLGGEADGPQQNVVIIGEKAILEVTLIKFEWNPREIFWECAPGGKLGRGGLGEKLLAVRLGAFDACEMGISIGNGTRRFLVEFMGSQFHVGILGEALSALAASRFHRNF